MGHCDTGHRTAVELRAAIEDEVGLGPLQLDPLGDLTVQGPLVGADNLALEHGHVSLVLRMVDLQVLVKGVRLNSVSDIRFMESESVCRVKSTFSSIGAVLSILQTDRTLPSVESPPPAVAGTFQPGLARPAAAVLLVHAAGLVKLDQLGLEGHAAGLAAPLCTKGPK